MLLLLILINYFNKSPKFIFWVTSI